MQIKRIALAFAFSPRLEANLAEASRIRSLFNAHLYLIHVGEFSSSDEQSLTGLLAEHQLNAENTSVEWKHGNTVETILECCNENEVDMLITGAMEKEGMLTYLKGSVARQLGRKAECSVLMLTEPSVHPHAFKNIVVSSNSEEEDKNTFALEMAVDFAKREKASINIIHEADYHRMAQLGSDIKSEDDISTLKNDLISEDRKKLDNLLSCTDCGGVQVNSLNLEGKPGIAISNFAREHSTDLLIISAPENKLGLFDRLFQHDMEYVLANLPCNLLIVHKPHLN